MYEAQWPFSGPALIAPLPRPRVGSFPSQVRERLLQDDCRHGGWVLTGFPLSAGQAKMLFDDPIRPSDCSLHGSQFFGAVHESCQMRMWKAQGGARRVRKTKSFPVNIRRAISLS